MNKRDEKGRKQGPWESFHYNGKLRQKGSYRNGLREGSWEFFYDNGKILSRGSYRNGIKVGLWME